MEPAEGLTVANPVVAPLVARTVLVKVPEFAPAVKSPLPLIVPPFATTAQVGVIATVLLPASRPTAVYCCVPFGDSTTRLGVMTMVESAPAVIVAVAVPEMAPLVARTVFRKVPAVDPAVNIPLASIAPPLATTDQTGVIATVLLFASVPTAVNCCAALIPSETGPGVTVMVASAPAETLTVATPEIVPLVALTVPVKAPATVPAVKSPVALTVPPAATTDQTGVMVTTRSSASRPTATYCCVPPIASVAGVGLTVMVATGRGSAGESHAASKNAVAAMKRPVVMPRVHCARSVRTVEVLLIRTPCSLGATVIGL